MADEVVFGEYRLPALKSGTYRITATQQLADGGTPLGAPFTAQVEIAVTGLRFTLPPDRIHGRFPGAGSSGDFGRILPHIVLDSPTLPWQREPDRRRTRTGDPWMALLVLDHVDGVPDVQTGPTSELLRSADYLGRPDEEIGDEATCQFIEIDQALFDELAPRPDDLRWLTHVREVGDAAYSVVVANRLPGDGVNTCFLVSLEGVWPRRCESRASVRIVVLDTWSFVCETDDRGFAATVGTLQAAGLRGHGEHPRHALGYSLLPHTMRQGARSASWYRGPLIAPEAAGSSTGAAAGDASDALLRYDPETGMFDVSLAAAWQLGRLLALANPEIAELISAWKAAGQREHARAGERELLSEQASVDALAPVEDQRDAFVGAVLEPAVKGLLA